MFCGPLNSCQLTISECISRPVFHVSAPSHVSGFANLVTNVTGSIANCYCIFTTLVSQADATGTGQWYKMPSTTVYLDSGASVTVSITNFYGLPLYGATNTGLRSTDVHSQGTLISFLRQMRPLILMSFIRIRIPVRGRVFLFRRLRHLLFGLFPRPHNHLY